MHEDEIYRINKNNAIQSKSERNVMNFKWYGITIARGVFSQRNLKNMTTRRS